MTTIPELSDAEIKKLEAKIAARDKEQQADKEALAKYREHRKLADIRKVSELIGELKLTVDEVASIPFVQLAIKQTLKAPVKGTAKSPSTTSKGNTSTYVKPPAKWRNAEGEEYGGGRGPVPKWVEAARANNTLDNYLIDKPE